MRRIRPQFRAARTEHDSVSLSACPSDQYAPQVGDKNWGARVNLSERQHVSPTLVSRYARQLHKIRMRKAFSPALFPNPASKHPVGAPRLFCATKADSQVQVLPPRVYSRTHARTSTPQCGRLKFARAHTHTQRHALTEHTHAHTHTHRCTQRGARTHGFYSSCFFWSFSFSLSLSLFFFFSLSLSLSLSLCFSLSLSLSLSTLLLSSFSVHLCLFLSFSHSLCFCLRCRVFVRLRFMALPPPSPPLSSLLPSPPLSSPLLPPLSSPLLPSPPLSSPSSPYLSPPLSPPLLPSSLPASPSSWV